MRPADRCTVSRGGLTTPEADPRPDAVLVALAQEGDDQAFEQLLVRHARMAFAIARGVVGDPDLAEDVCQDALFRVWRRLKECRDRDRFAAWMARAVQRHALNAIRSRGKSAAGGLEELSDRGPSPEREAEQADLRNRLDRALRMLSTEQRQAVLLFDLEGCSHAEVAELLGISPDMSRQHVMLGRRRLRQLLAQQEGRP